MDRTNISIATITWARDEDEEILLQKALKHLSTLNIPVFVTDGGSANSFLDFIKSLPNFHLTGGTVKGVWPQTSHSLSKAFESDSKSILYTEPDKLDFFTKGLEKMLDSVEVNELSGIILASRSQIGFSSFPVFQQMTESAINSCCAEIIGQELDYTYGPFILNRAIIPYLHLMEQDLGWGWRTFTFGLAKRLGLSIQAHVDGFECPLNQQLDNTKERTLRMKQLSQQIEGILLSTTVTPKQG